MPSVPKVAMNGGSFSRETMTALTEPSSTPTPEADDHGRGQGTPTLTSATSMTPTRDITPPTDRSMPPVTMTRVMPKATTERIAAWDMTFSRLASVAKKGTNWPTSSTAATIEHRSGDGAQERCPLATGIFRVSPDDWRTRPGGCASHLLEMGRP